MDSDRNNSRAPLLDVVVDQVAAKLKLSDAAKAAIRGLPPRVLGELLFGKAEK